ncbi:cAMP phosphodiesterase [Prochlorococcus marinus]|uniref:cAMP phosphodiesterase n=1 Tax=Prochlorococcus marinus TaxID=1219 RepID=UPI0002E358B1|nr:cAMP phosphodiesterase [Prochlorococcus marinus]
MLALLCLFQLPATAKNKQKNKPATDEDTFLYRTLGGSYICNARTAGIEFPKAVGIASGTYVQVLEGKHGGKVKSVGKKKLGREQLYTGAEFQVITAAIQFCPDKVPDDIKEKVKSALDKELKKKD